MNLLISSLLLGYFLWPAPQEKFIWIWTRKMVVYVSLYYDFACGVLCPFFSAYESKISRDLVLQQVTKQHLYSCTNIPLYS